MTVQNTTQRATTTGNDTTGTYPYTFRIFSDEHIVVQVISPDGLTVYDLELDVDYNVTGVGSYSGGNIVLIDDDQAWLGTGNFLNTDYDIVRYRQLPLTQLTDLRNRSGFFPAEHEDAFDRLTMVCLQQQDELDRTLKFPAVDGVSLTTTLDAAASRASTLLGFDSSGNADTLTAAEVRALLDLEAGTDVQAYDAELAAIAGLTSAADKAPYFTGSGTAALADLTAFARTLLDDANAATARATLGLILGTDVQAYSANLAQVAGLADPDADRILFWDDSAGTFTFLTVGANLEISGTTLNASGEGGGGGGTGDMLMATYDPDENGVIGIAQGGTNATSASAARTSLGVEIGADVQAYSANLDSVAANISAFGLTLIDDADASAARTTLGLVIGTNVQAYDAELAAVAGLTSAANKIPRFTGSGTADLIDFLDEDAMTSNSASAVASQQSVKAYVDGKLGTLNAPSATTSGTSKTVTGIPSTAKLVRLHLLGVAMDFSEASFVGLALKAGTSGGISGTYRSALRYNGGEGNSSSVIFLTTDAAGAARVFDGTIDIHLVDATNFIYNVNWQINSALNMYNGSGTFDLAGALERVQLASLDEFLSLGTVDMTAGSVALYYE